MKELILKLREEGKSYSQIQKELNCSKGTIAYHCGEGQKSKTRARMTKYRKNPVVRKTETFNNKSMKNVVEALRKFQKRIPYDKNIKADKNIKKTFRWKDVVSKFGSETICYLTGQKIDLYKDNYSFDHIIPFSKGGKNTIDNLGICLKEANMMKTDLLLDEFFEMCKKILEHKGYKVEYCSLV